MPSTEQPALPPRSLATALASGAALGALTLPAHHRLSPGRRHLLRVATAAWGGWYGWNLARTLPIPFVPTAALGAAATAALTLASAPVDEAFDAGLERRLLAWGLNRPRLILAAAAAGLGTLALLDTVRAAEEEDWVDAEELFDDADLSPAIAALIAALLNAEDSESSRALLEQLGQARAQVFDEGFSASVYLTVPEEAATVVPRLQEWPIHAHFEVDGLPLRVDLTIGEGRLTAAHIMLRDEELDEDDPRWEIDIEEVLHTWPGVEQVRLMRETPQGLVAL